MSHHFDTEVARRDPRLNVADMYVFEGTDDSTVFVQTANADAGLSAPYTFHDEAIYSFRLHQTRDGEETLAFKFRFSDPAPGGQAVQHYRLYQSGSGESANLQGALILQAESGKTIQTDNGIKVYVGPVHEMWSANAFAFGDFLHALWSENRFAPEIWAANPTDFFNRRNAVAIVLEVPNRMLPKGTINVWANITMYGHAEEIQIARWGLPIFSHLFLSRPDIDGAPDMSVIEAYHRHHPSEDLLRFGPYAHELVARMSRAAGSAVDPNEYAQSIVKRLCPTMLPYEVGTKASFATERFNGRPLADDTLDVMFTLAANVPVSDHVAPPAARTIASFPYYGPPYSQQEQSGLRGIPQHDRSAYQTGSLSGS